MTVCSRAMSWAVAQHVAHRRPAQGVGAAGGVGDPVGEVGAAAGDELEGEGRRRRRRTLAASQSVTGPRSIPSTSGVGVGRRGRRSVRRPCPDATRAGASRPVPDGGRSARRPGIVAGDGRRHRCHLRGGGPRRAPPRSRWWSTCGPRGAGRARPSGPILEQAVAATDGAVELAKVNVDENPAISASFQVQSIPAVFAVRDGAGGRPVHRRPARGRGRRRSSTGWPRRRPRPTCWPTRARAGDEALAAPGPRAAARPRRWPSRPWPRC